MPIGGENVGTAYVRILADGQGLDDSIRETFDDSNDSFDEAGRRSSKAYSEGFADEMKKSPNQTKLRKSITDTLARGDFLQNTFFRSKNWTGFRAGLVKEFGDAGRLMGDNLEKGLLEGMTFEGLEDRLDNLLAERSNALKQLAAAQVKIDKETEERQRRMLDEAYRLNREHTRKLKMEQDRRAEDWRTMLNEAYALNKDFTQKVRFQNEQQAESYRDMINEAYFLNRQFNLRATKANRDHALSVKELNTSYRDLLIDITRVEQGTDKLARGVRRDLLVRLRETRQEFDRLGLATHETNLEMRDHEFRLKRLHPLLQRSVVLTDRWSDSIGRTFGKGSRSEVLNFFGRIIGGMVGMIGLVPRAILFVRRMGSAISEAFAKEGTIGLIKLTFSTLAQGLAGLITVGAVAVVVASTIGVLSSALLSLAGAATAMASSLAFAAGGGVAVLAGALVPLAAGIGVATLAIMNMDKETKKAFDGIGKSFKALGEDAALNIFDSAKEDAEALTKAIDGLRRITGPVSKALGGLLDEFIASLNNPDMVRFQNFLGKVLPDMVTSLGHIFGNLGLALQGIFIAIAPATQDFLDWLERVTGDFAKWTNSGKGRTAIEDFMERAKESAKQVGATLEQVIGLIGDLFGASNQQGNTLFASLTATIEGWRQKLQEARDDGTFQQWIDDAGRVARAIGEMIPALAEFIDKLDTPQNRQLVINLANAFVSVVGAIGDMMAAFQLFGAVMKGIYNRLIGPTLSIFLKAIGFVLGALASMFESLDSIPGAPKWIGETAEALRDAEGDVLGLSESIKQIPDANVTVTGPSPATISKIESQLEHLSRPRTATITINTRLTGHPGPGAGGQDDTSDRSTYDPSVTRFTAPTSTTGGDLGGTKDYNSRTVSADGWTIVTPTTDPEAVAAEVFNRLAGAGY